MTTKTQLKLNQAGIKGVEKRLITSPYSSLPALKSKMEIEKEWYVWSKKGEILYLNLTGEDVISEEISMCMIEQFLHNGGEDE